MKIEHSGWNMERGSFRYFVVVNENKQDYVIQFKNGCYARQAEPFHLIEADWNCDGDVYIQFGAYFSCYDKEGKPDGGSFWTPREMVESLIRSLEGEDNGGYTVVAIPGIEIPSPDKRPSLDNTILINERRAAAQTIEKNRQMNMFGFRSESDKNTER